jgi:hypothetical protein
MVLLIAVVVTIGALAGCGDDGEVDRPDPDRGVEPAPDPGAAPTTAAPSVGELDLDVPDGAVAVPLPSLGIGLVLPEGWEAVVLTGEALDRVEALDVSPGFVDAARNARAAGGVLYAAGVDEAGGVADLKLVRLPEVDLDAAEAGAVAAAPEGAAVDRPEGTERPTVRIRFRVEGEDAAGEAVAAEGTQWLLEGPEDIWSVIVTSEDDPEGHDRLARALLDSIAFPRGT